MAGRVWTLYVCETCQATRLRGEGADFPHHGGPVCWCQNTAPRLMTAVEVVPRAAAEALAGLVREARSMVPHVDEPSDRRNGWCARADAALAIYPKAEEESDGQ